MLYRKPPTACSGTFFYFPEEKVNSCFSPLKKTPPKQPLIIFSVICKFKIKWVKMKNESLKTTFTIAITASCVCPNDKVTSKYRMYLNTTLASFYPMYANCWTNCGRNEKAWRLICTLVFLFSLIVLIVGLGQALHFNILCIAFNKRSTEIKTMDRYHIRCLSCFGKPLIKPSNIWLKTSYSRATWNYEISTAPLFQ